MLDLGNKPPNSNPVRVLFLTDDREDYLADGILHGLKQISSLQVTDYPKKNCLYESALPQEPFAVRGGGFSLYRLLKDVPDSFDRAHIQQKLEKEWFDLIVISNIWRQWGLLVQWERLLNSDCKLAILDGDDDERFYPSSTTRIRDFGPTRWLDKLINRDDTIYFKREWTNRTKQWPYSCVIKKLSFSIPAEKIRSTLLKKTRLFPNHIVDQEVSNLVGGQTHYAFSSEDGYRQNLAESRFGITTKRGGWECLRHYEIAANGAIPCFRNLTEKPTECAPHGLKDGVNCISYRNAQELMEQINQLTHQDELRMRQAALSWARSSSTQARAHELLNAMNITL
jgi:hypothetical protein